jgi:uncharacterized protein
MQIPKDAVLLRIFIGESDRHRRQPLYEAIVLKAREMPVQPCCVGRWDLGNQAICTRQKFFAYPWTSQS